MHQWRQMLFEKKVFLRTTSEASLVVKNGDRVLEVKCYFHKFLAEKTE